MTAVAKEKALDKYLHQVYPCWEGTKGTVIPFAFFLSSETWGQVNHYVPAVFSDCKETFAGLCNCCVCLWELVELRHLFLGGVFGSMPQF